MCRLWSNLRLSSLVYLQAIALLVLVGTAYGEVTVGGQAGVGAPAMFAMPDDYQGATNSTASSSYAVKVGDLILECSMGKVVYTVAPSNTTVYIVAAGTATVNWSGQSGNVPVYALVNFNATQLNGGGCYIGTVATAGNVTFTQTVSLTGGTITSYINNFSILFLQRGR